MNVDKIRTIVLDAIIKLSNITILTIYIDKRYTLYYNVVTKGLNIAISTVNIDKRCTLHYNLIRREGKHSFGEVLCSISLVLP